MIPEPTDVDGHARRIQDVVEGEERHERVSDLRQALLVRAARQCADLISDAERRRAHLIADADGRRDAVLADAEVRREAMIAEGERQRAAALADARRIRTEAHAEREALKSQTLEHIADLTGDIIAMATELTAASPDPDVARLLLAQFVLSLTHAAERTYAEVETPARRISGT